VTTPASASRSIFVRQAREHNLKGIDVRIPRDRLVVITGLSGSGKSSLAFDTIYAEGQRRYVESLSAYARQFLEQRGKPDVESIEGLSPAISIEQKTVSRNPRSTVGTTTEISDHLRLLFARIGQPHCPSCGEPISSQTVQQMTDRVLALDAGSRVQILAPVVRGRKGEHRKELEQLRKQGFVRARIDGTVYDLADDFQLAKERAHEIEVVVDRLVVQPSVRARLTESIETALRLADGLLLLDVGPGGHEQLMSERNACIDCGISFPEIAPRMFSFNSPHGACPTCWRAAPSNRGAAGAPRTTTNSSLPRWRATSTSVSKRRGATCRSAPATESSTGPAATPLRSRSITAESRRPSNAAGTA
jgi:excinuclease ABC subunit A